MFRSEFFCPLGNYIYIHLLSNEGKYEQIKYEQCALGKNINLKYKDLIEKFQSIEGSHVNFYYCINYNNTNYTLYRHPSQPNNEENNVEIRVYSECEEFYLTFELITQNDLIDHNKKDNPIIPYYKVNRYILTRGEKNFLVIIINI